MFYHRLGLIRFSINSFKLKSWLDEYQFGFFESPIGAGKEQLTYL